MFFQVEYIDLEKHTLDHPTLSPFGQFLQWNSRVTYGKEHYSKFKDFIVGYALERRYSFEADGSYASLNRICGLSNILGGYEDEFREYGNKYEPVYAVGDTIEYSQGRYQWTGSEVIFDQSSGGTNRVDRLSEAPGIYRRKAELLAALGVLSIEVHRDGGVAFEVDPDLPKVVSLRVVMQPAYLEKATYRRTSTDDKMACEIADETVRQAWGQRRLAELSLERELLERR